MDTASPPEIISHAVWLYHRFSLSFREVEDLLAERGITVSYEAILFCGRCRLPSGVANAILIRMACAIERRKPMGDKSPKSKKRDQKQKDAARSAGAAKAKSKQGSGSWAPMTPAKGKR